MYISTTAVENVRVHADHDSEGALLNLSDGNILHVYRTDPGSGGDHVGAGGKLVKRTFDTTSNTWGSISDVFSDAYDDRNIHGGVTDTGRLVIFFSRYNVAGAAYVDHNFIYSDDDGATWSARSALTLGRTDASAYGDMIYVPTKGYMMSFQRNYYSEIMFSADGSSWGSNVVVGNYVAASSYNLTEACFAYIGSGQMVGIVRDGNSGVPYQITSGDYGATWSTPVRSNIMGTFGVSPKLIVYGGSIIALFPDRRSTVADPGGVGEEGIFIVEGVGTTVYSNSKAWIKRGFVLRPDTTLNQRFYGYPAIAEISTGYYLVVFSDVYDEGATEDSNLYQFYLRVKDFRSVQDKTALPSFRKV